MVVREVAAPDGGVWRVARAPDPLALPDLAPRSSLDKPQLGNRFDSPSGSYRTLYFATTLSGCYGETLARFRPDPALAAVIGDDWSRGGFMGIGDVPADWRQRRTAVQARFPKQAPFGDGIRFLDVEALDTREVLRRELGGVLAYYDFDDLDVATVRGGDRRITRMIGQWAFEQANDRGLPRFAGIRYLSRLNTDWECWAVFDHVPIEEMNRKPLLSTDVELRAVCKAYGLTAH